MMSRKLELIDSQFVSSYFKIVKKYFWFTMESPGN